MKISARNAFEGSITALVDGKVNAEVEVTTPVGKPAIAYVKAPWVMVLAGAGGVKFSARNQLAGVVDSVQKGAVNSDVAIRLAGGALVHAVITNEAVMELGLKPGVPACALIKASHVVLGVPA